MIEIYLLGTQDESMVFSCLVDCSGIPHWSSLLLSCPPQSSPSNRVWSCLKCSKDFPFHFRIKLYPLTVACSSLCDWLIIPHLNKSLVSPFAQQSGLYVIHTCTTLGHCTLLFPPHRNRAFGSMGSWVHLEVQVGLQCYLFREAFPDHPVCLLILNYNLSHHSV